MQHIDNFTIGRFRGLRDLRIENLGQINLFVGNNNSGKTSVLEALSLFCDPLNWRKWYEATSTREVSNNLGRFSLIDRLTWLFPQMGDGKVNGSTQNPEISFSAQGSFPIEKVSATYEKYAELMPLARATYSIEDIGVEEKEMEREGLKIHVVVFASQYQPTLFDELDGSVKETLVFTDNITPAVSRQRVPVLPTQIVNPFSHRSSTLLPSLWSDVVEADLKAETIELLRFFDPGIQEIDIISPTVRRQDISVKHAKLGRAPLNTFGDGLRRVFTLATTIPRVKDGLLLVDELETAIHTRALEKTFDWLVKACVHSNVQLFATTHSLEALDSLIEVSRDSADLVVYRLQQDRTQTTATRFDKDMIIRLREELGQEVR